MPRAILRDEFGWAHKVEDLSRAELGSLCQREGGRERALVWLREQVLRSAQDCQEARRSALG